MQQALTQWARNSTSDNKTVKWAWQLDDGKLIESVLMHYRDWSTVCVSSQSGCAMGCGFCATGQMGYERHLTVGEIVEQVVRARQEALPRRLSNVVFMGMGEPLANFNNVWEAVGRIHHDIGLSARNITVSTVGIVPGIRKLTAANTPVSLAVSLHAATNEKRDSLVPINKTYPLEELEDACQEWVATTRRRLSIEWALIANTNDTENDAKELSLIAQRLKAHVNLIPLNPTPGFGVLGSSATRVKSFRDNLSQAGVRATVRRTRGVDIDAACGQLANRSKPSPQRIAVVAE